MFRAVDWWAGALRLSCNCPSRAEEQFNKMTDYIYLLTYLLTYSMEQRPSWEANWFAGSQEIPRISRNPNVHYCTHKRPPPVPILGQPNPVHIPTSNLLEIRPNIIHPSTPTSPQWSPSFQFPHQDHLHPLLQVQSSQGCQKLHRDQKYYAKCVHTSRWCWRYSLILRALFTMSFYHKAGQSIRSIIWKLCNVFVRQSGKKKTWCVAGESMDAPTWQRALTRDDCPSIASVLSRSRASWLSSVSKAQINAERPPVSVYWGDKDKFASAFALHS